MKKTLIVFTNARVGGIQKALISYLQENAEKEDITLLLFYKDGKLLNEIPSSVKVLEACSDYKYFGMAQKDCITIRDKAKRGFYAILGRFAGQRAVLWLISKTDSYMANEEYDEAISFIHVTYFHTIYGGVPQYVLHLNNAKKKTCYVHCDYLHSGTRSTYSDSIYKRFDEIVCVSESTKKLFIQAIPEMREKVVAKYNSINKKEIHEKADTDSYKYNPDYINCITVARLSREKGIIRVIEAMKNIGSNMIRYYIVGEGEERENIEEKIQEYGFKDNIILLGEQENPYRYMANADLLILPSFHEAAPVVFQEAIELGIPILTTRTSSADEMVSKKNGIVVDNDDKAIEAELKRIIENPHMYFDRF